MVFMSVFFSCKAEQESRPNSSEAELLGGDMTVSWIPAN